MPRKPLTAENKEAMRIGRTAYFDARRAAKQAALAPVQEPPKTKRKYVRKVTVTQAAPVHKTEKRGRPTRPVIETLIHKPYTFATVSTKVGGEIVTSHGFAKWDNTDTPAWNENLGKDIAIGRAKKELEKKHGIKIKG